MKWGALFDWDGVVIDSSQHHEESWERLAREEGRDLPEGHFRRGFGMKNEFIIPNILAWTADPAEVHRLSLRKEALYREVVREWGLEPLPGVVPWLDTLRNEGVPCAIGSSTHRENIELSLRILGMGGFFAGMVTSENVSHGKPHPEVFQKAAGAIERSPDQCVVFEDAFVGIEAAHNAGAKVVAVATTNPIETLHDADVAVHRLDELSIEQIDGWFS